MDRSLPGSSVYRISQASALERVAISFSRGSFRPKDWADVSCTGKWILHHWAISYYSGAWQSDFLISFLLHLLIIFPLVRTSLPLSLVSLYLSIYSFIYLCILMDFYLFSRLWSFTIIIYFISPFKLALVCVFFNVHTIIWTLP